MDKETLNKLLAAINELEDNQANIAMLGVTAGVVLAGMGVQTNDELNNRHDEFNEKFHKVLMTLEADFKNGHDGDFTLLMHAGKHVFDYVNYIQVSIEEIYHD